MVCSGDRGSRKYQVGEVKRGCRRDRGREAAAVDISNRKWRQQLGPSLGLTLLDSAHLVRLSHPIMMRVAVENDCHCGAKWHGRPSSEQYGLACVCLAVVALLKLLLRIASDLFS